MTVNTGTGGAVGISPIAFGDRRLGFTDYLVLWGDLGIGLLVLLAGSLLVPGLGFGHAILAIIIGSVVGSFLLALVGVLGSRTGLPTMVLTRPSLGLRGSFLPTALNMIQLVGWSAFEIIVMAQAADGITRGLLGRSIYPGWVIFFGIFCTALAVWGPVAVVRKWLEKFAVWMMLLTTLWLGWQLLRRSDLGQLLSTPGTGELSFWFGVDLAIAMPVSWIPLVADYSRFSRSGRGAFWGTFLGYTAANVIFYGLGAALVLALKVQDLIVAILGLAAGWIALLVILVDETDEAFADIYSTAVSIQNLAPGLPHRGLVLAVGVFSTLIALAVPVAQYEHFLLLIGSVFVPLFGVVLADFFLLRRGAYSTEACFRASGPFWYWGGVNWWGILAWVLGIASYRVIAWKAPWLGASLPSFMVAFLGHWLLVRLFASVPEVPFSEGRRA